MEKKFTMSYDASMKEEVRKIKDKYDESVCTNIRREKYLQIRHLDRKACIPAAIVCIVLALSGMTFFALGMNEAINGTHLILGMASGFAGIVVFAINPLVHKLILKKSKSKYASKIIKLSEELL